MLSTILKSRRKVPPLDYTSLHAQIVSEFDAFMEICGLDWLLNPGTAIVMGKDHHVFLYQNADGSENPDLFRALVYLRDMDGYEEFKVIQSDESLRATALGQITIGFLADQAAKQLLKRASQAGEGTSGPDRQTLAD